MKNRKYRVAAFLIVATTAVVTGCSSNIAVHEISGLPTDRFDGIPVLIAARQQVTVYQLQADGTYAQVETTRYPIPDQSRLLTVGIDADMFANATLNLSLNDDGTLKSAAISSTPSGQAALTQLGTSISAVGTAAATYDQQRQKTEQTALQQALATSQAQQAIPAAQDARVLAYRQALVAVIQEQALIQDPPAGTTALNLADDEATLQVLELQANQAAGMIGLAPPFPAANKLR